MDDEQCRDTRSEIDDLIFKEYQYSDGRIVRLTRQEFESVVSVFATLAYWRDQQNKEP